MQDKILEIRQEAFKLKQTFSISRGSKIKADVITVIITKGAVQGKGECVPYARYGETVESVAAQITNLPKGITHDELPYLLPVGAARNAVDCALWDLRAKEMGKSVWELAELMLPQPVLTAYTLSLQSPKKMQQEAKKNAFRPLLKTKLGGGRDDIERIRAVRLGAPKSEIIVDANEGWMPEFYREIAPEFVALGVTMVEQPFSADKDDALLHLDRVLPVCADESCHDCGSLPHLKGKYDMINIKLDKTGGLTEAIKLKEKALLEGYDIMIGCMIGSSLAMAPAVLLAQDVKVVDLDGPLLLAEDRDYPLLYNDNKVSPAHQNLWG